jgi:dGTPase
LTFFGRLPDQMIRDPAARGVGRRFLHSMAPSYIKNHPPAAVVRDYLAAMTDDFFLCQARQPGCDIPERTCATN